MLLGHSRADVTQVYAEKNQELAASVDAVSFRWIPRAENGRANALVWAALHIIVGRMLKKLRPSARLMTLGLAVGNLILLPFGTALGVYALWVLLKDEGRRLFEPTS